MHININEVEGRQKNATLRLFGLFDGTGFSFDVVGATLTGAHSALTNDRSDRAYFVLSGSGRIRVDTDVHNVREGSLVTVAKGQVHELVGNCTYLIVTSPPRRDGDEREAASELTSD